MKVRSRFSYFRDKLQVFVLGFLLGIVLGGGFFLLKLDSYVKELSFYKSLTEKDEKDLNDLDKLADENKNPKKTKTKKSDSRNYGLTDNVAMSSDSASGDSTSQMDYSNEAGGDEIIVRKDELLGQKTIAVNNLDHPEEHDSITGKPAADNPKSYLTVEFWKSPLNYRGYKYSRNKLVIFGLETGDIESIFKTENSTYLKSSIGLFRLETSTDFRQMERVTDESLISKMQ